uniref:Integrase core domain containing protein n=1 Tax=Solanum tuberosum TaxID=4113 RepID=M1DZG5_SOLTU
MENWCQGQGNQGQNYGNYNREGQYVRDGNFNRDNNYNRNNYGNRNDQGGPYVPPQNRESDTKEVGGNMARIEDMMQKMMRRFEATDKNVKEMRNDLSGIGQKVDVHAVSIKNLEQQMTLLSSTVNPRQPGTLLSNTIQNPKNYGHCMAVTTRGGKQTIDPHMPSVVDVEIRKEDDVVEVREESENATEKKAKISQKLVPKPRPPPPFPIEQMPGYEKFMKDMVTKKRSVSFEDDDRLQHYSSIATRSLV